MLNAYGLLRVLLTFTFGNEELGKPSNVPCVAVPALTSLVRTLAPLFARN